MSSFIVIVGPTGVGKTTLSIAIAKAIGAEIISADAMQFYRGLNIGTAKISEAEKQDIPHHLIDFLNPVEEFSVAQYQKTVRDKIESLKRLNTPIVMVGGSGLFLQAVLFDYEFSGDRRTNQTLEIYRDKTNQQLHEYLKELNPELSESVHPNNRRRLLRSLEIASSKSKGFFEKGKNLFYDDVTLIGLQLQRDVLYNTINRRVNQMIENGLVEEVRSLYDRQITSQSVMAIGYKELYSYFNGDIELHQAIELIKLHSRRYAKRQLTWFHNKMNIKWFDVDLDDFDNTLNQVLESIKKAE